jgi:deoxyribodipyrimidine photo-lyase
MQVMGAAPLQAIVTDNSPRVRNGEQPSTIAGIAPSPLARYRTALCWFRRDLRCDDHAALHAALAASERVHCVFVFDTEILDKLPERRDRRVEFIYDSVAELDRALRALGGGLIVRHACAREEIPRLAAELRADAVYANRDYEPAAAGRDEAVGRALDACGIGWLTAKDQVIFERDEILTQTGKTFTVFTPYRNAWLKKLGARELQPHDIEALASRLAPAPVATLPPLEAIGFERTGLRALGVVPGMAGARARYDSFLPRLDRYHEQRNAVDEDGTSRLSVHLRFGTISIRELARTAWLARGPGPDAWLNELAWRDFFFMIVHHYPHVAERAFRPEFENLRYTNDPARYAAWCEGRTGYPLVDAGMRQLNETGFMHNRLRMLTASFLVKDLLVDWRSGERYFAQKLLDYDLAANNGGWQWAASTGCDAQPYFRIFNPVTQSEKFDPEGRCIRRYVPELRGCSDKAIHTPWQMTQEQQRAAGVRIDRDYPLPIVDHAQARREALALYASAREV